jgi:pimeloyl-ACP methyl ester carboxylesterase
VNNDQFVTVMGARIRYRTEGRGPNLLLLHGLGASLEVWNWTVPALRDRYATIALDFPGFGQSDGLESTLTPEGAARIVLAFMDALGLQRAALIGSSLGGSIATLAAGTAPERFTAVVLAAPGGFDAGLSPLLRLQTIRGIGEVLLMLVRPAPRFAIRFIFADPRRIPDELVDITRNNAKRASSGMTYLRALRAGATLQGIRLERIYAVRQAAARITAPTLVVWGDRDHVIPRDQGAVAAQTIPGARLLMIRGAGHVPFIEDPAVFNDAVSAFLADAVRPAEAGSPR